MPVTRCKCSDQHRGSSQSQATPRSATAASSSAITGVQARANDATAEGLFKVEALAGDVSGVAARIAAYLRASTSSGYSSTAGWMIDLLTNGTSRMVLEVDRFTFLNGSSRVSPFTIEGGNVYMQNAYIKNLTADNIEYDAVNQMVTDKVILSSDADVANMIALVTHGEAQGSTVAVYSSGANVTPMRTYAGSVVPNAYPTPLSTITPNAGGGYSSAAPWVNIAQCTMAVTAPPAGRTNKFIISFQVAGEVKMFASGGSSGAYLTKSGIVQTRLVRSSAVLDDANTVTLYDGNGDLGSDRRGITISDELSAGGSVTWVLQARYLPLANEINSGGQRYKAHSAYIKSRSLVVQWVKR